MFTTEHRLEASPATECRRIKLVNVTRMIDIVISLMYQVAKVNSSIFANFHHKMILFTILKAMMKNLAHQFMVR